MSTDEMMAVLKNWKTLNQVIGQLDEPTVTSLLNFETMTKARKSMQVRLHQRYVTLRDERERNYVIQGGLL